MILAFSLACLLSATSVRIGALGGDTNAVGVICKEDLGNFTSAIPMPDDVRRVAAACGANGWCFSLGEIFDRRKMCFTKPYDATANETFAAVRAAGDVFDSSNLFAESGGLLFYWAAPAVAGAVNAPPRPATGGDAVAFVLKTVREFVRTAETAGLPRPYSSAEASFGMPSYLYRAGIDRVDVENTFSSDLERTVAGVKTAAEAFGKSAFGMDVAVGWYGGIQDDALRQARWRTALLHAYLRGASPIFWEEGVANGGALADRLRKTLRDVSAWVRAHPRADGLPRAAAAAVYGRHDGYVGAWQTHLWGQRGDDRFRIGDAERAWTIFDGVFARGGWQDRDRWGAADLSGNPPLGTLDIVSHAADDAFLSRYGFLFFLGRNVMDEALHAKLLRYVKGGGVLLLSAAHLDTCDVPGGGYAPFRGGDFRELCGVRLDFASSRRLEIGVKFKAEPGCGWRFQPLRPLWDPDFTDGGFAVPSVVTNAGATVLAVESDRFKEFEWKASARPVLFSHAVGKGHVVFLATPEPVGATGVRRMYEALVRSGLAAVEAWPKVECSDRVRWSVYPDGTVYLLNTEPNLSEKVLVRTDASASVREVEVKPQSIEMLKP